MERNSQARVILEGSPILLDTNSLFIAYLNLCGKSAILLYGYLISADHLETLTHQKIVEHCQSTLEQLQYDLSNLEQYELIEAYYAKIDQQDTFTYILKSPLPIQAILSHEVFGRVLLQKLGSHRYERLRQRFSDKPSSKEAYTNISTAFDKKVLHAYDASNEQHFNSDPSPKAILENRFNSKMFLIECSLTTFPQNLRTKTNIQVISDLGSLYNIPIIDMCTYVGKASTVNMVSNESSFSVEKLKGYVMHNSEAVALEKDPYASSPILFLKSLQDNREPTTTEKRWISDLVTDQRLNYGVINVLLEYVLKTQNGQLNRAFVETVAATWARQNIETKEQALKALKDYNPKAKSQKQSKSVQSDFSGQQDSLSVDEVKDLKERLKKIGK